MTLSNPHHPLTITFLGGLEEVGMNALLLSWNDHHLMIDCGIGFPDAQHYPGVDVVVPDFESLDALKGTFEGVILTHGHEDHIGGISHLLKLQSPPIFGTAFPLQLVRSRLHERQIPGTLNTVTPGETHQIGPFEVEWIPVAHSIPGSCAVSVRTPQHHIVHTGDFKIEIPTSAGSPNPLPRLGALGHEGVDLLLCESTNVFQHGFSKTEDALRPALEELLANSRGRVFLVAFSTHIERVRMAIELARQTGRKIAVFGASLERNIQLARELGLLQFQPNEWISQDAIHSISPRRLLILATGSQAEPNAAMTRIAMRSHGSVEIEEGDQIIWSARQIPGNENAIGYIIDQIVEQGGNVHHSPLHPVHASGHGYRQELQLMMQLIQPTYFVPIHGRPAFLAENQRMAIATGIPPENTLFCRNGDRISLHHGELQPTECWTLNPLYLTRSDGPPLSPQRRKERRVLAQHGICFVSAQLNSSGRLSGPPFIDCVGIPADKEQLEREWPQLLLDGFQNADYEQKLSKADIEQLLKRLLRNHLRATWNLQPKIITTLHTAPLR